VKGEGTPGYIDLKLRAVITSLGMQDISIVVTCHYRCEEVVEIFVIRRFIFIKRPLNTRNC